MSRVERGAKPGGVKRLWSRWAEFSDTNHAGLNAVFVITAILGLTAVGLVYLTRDQSIRNYADCLAQYQKLDQENTATTRKASKRARARVNHFYEELLEVLTLNTRRTDVDELKRAVRRVVNANDRLDRVLAKHPALPPSSAYCEDGVFNPPKSARVTTIGVWISGGPTNLPDLTATYTAPSTAQATPKPTPAATPKPVVSATPTVTPQPSFPSPTPTAVPSPTPGLIGGLIEDLDTLIEDLLP